jgi:hypothetical protein
VFNFIGCYGGTTCGDTEMIKMTNLLKKCSMGSSMRDIPLRFRHVVRPTRAVTASGRVSPVIFAALQTLRGVVSISIVIGLWGTRAHAQADMDECKALLIEQVRSINAGDAKAFAATFDPERGYAVLPTAADEGLGENAIELAARHWLGAIGKVTLKLEHPLYSYSSFAAELIGKPTGRWRITGVVCGGESTNSASRVCALHLSEATADKTAIAAAAAGKLPGYPKTPANEYPNSGLKPEAFREFGKALTDDTVVIGSAAHEYAVGKAAVKKLLASWKSLKLAPLDVRTDLSDPGGWALGWAFGHVEASFLARGRLVKVPYRVLVLVLYPPAAAQDPIVGDPEPVRLISAHFSIAMH